MLAVDVLLCGVCVGRRRLIAQITQPSVAQAIPGALGLPSDAPPAHPALVSRSLV